MHAFHWQVPAGTATAAPLGRGGALLALRESAPLAGGTRCGAPHGGYPSDYSPAHAGGQSEVCVGRGGASHGTMGGVGDPSACAYGG